MVSCIPVELELFLLNVSPLVHRNRHIGKVWNMHASQETPSVLHSALILKHEEARSISTLP